VSGHLSFNNSSANSKENKVKRSGHYCAEYYLQKPFSILIFQEQRQTTSSLSADYCIIPTLATHLLAAMDDLSLFLLSLDNEVEILPTMTFFPKLPPEIRNIVWTFAAMEPEIFSVCFL
jgi:hypothetical protein